VRRADRKACRWGKGEITFLLRERSETGQVARAKRVTEGARAERSSPPPSPGFAGYFPRRRGRNGAPERTKAAALSRYGPVFCVLSASGRLMRLEASPPRNAHKECRDCAVASIPM